jgi:hypothetical protein
LLVLWRGMVAFDELNDIRSNRLSTARMSVDPATEATAT